MTVLYYIFAGALLGFGWIFGEHAATKVVDKLESPSKKKNKKNEIEHKKEK
ncbi:MAG: hypothetical protein HQL29_01380 [Candidatus Omnitrophica bacterium]|nr:hypothetical protein [Candidatus Omnitrophota bacterium]